MDKPSKSIYGNLPYIAPEVIAGKEVTTASDIYSIGIIMWELSSGQSPFLNYNHTYDFALRIVSGMRPKILSGTPSEYRRIMKQCWDAIPQNRPTVFTLVNEIEKLWKNCLNDSSCEYNSTISEISQSSGDALYPLPINISSSTIYRFDNLPDPKNATPDEQEDPTNDNYLLNALSTHFSSHPNYNLKYIGLTNDNYDHTGSIIKLLKDYKQSKVLLGESKDDKLLKYLCRKDDIADRCQIIKQDYDEEFEFYDIFKPIFTFGNPSGSLSYLHIPSNSVFIGDLIMNISYLSYPSITLPLTLTIDQLNNVKLAITQIFQLDNVKHIFPSHDYSHNGVDIKLFRDFVKKFIFISLND
ncbi:17825_t:CDS:2 [Funneliformis geosporum]|nr:17825_t:CDS:2 [Funneliformis geosporum]